MIRKVYNLAIAEFIADQKYYPFGKGKIQIRIPESEKIGLSINEFKRLESVTNLTILQQHALNTLLISFYFAGIRVSDVLQLRWSDFNDERLLLGSRSINSCNSYRAFAVTFSMWAV